MWYGTLRIIQEGSPELAKLQGLVLGPMGKLYSSTNVGTYFWCHRASEYARFVTCPLLRTRADEDTNADRVGESLPSKYFVLFIKYYIGSASARGLRCKAMCLFMIDTLVELSYLSLGLAAPDTMSTS